VTAAIVLSTGCGGGGGSTTATTQRAAPAVAGPDQPTTQVVLRKPADGTVLRARVRDAAAARVAVPIEGFAAPAQTLLVSASCRQRACRRFVRSDEIGNFATTLHLALKGAPSRLTLRVDYGVTPSDTTAATGAVRLRIRRIATPRRSAVPHQEAAPAPAPSPQATPSQPEIATPAPSGDTTARRRLIVVGDSLAVGMRPYLAGELSSWQVSIDGRVGRPLAEGMGVLAATSITNPSRTVLAISLFTNDDPTRTSALRSAIATSLSRVGADGCVVWATITRPPVGGVTYAAANRIITQAAADDERLRVVPWAAYTAAHPEVLAADGVHPSPDGYRARAALYAQAAASCG
jgi:hypothetical protein